MAIISKSFADLWITFQRNPFSSDLQVVKNENAIKQSLLTLVKTNIYERPFNPLLGSRLQQLLFENFDSGTSSSIEDELRILISNYEPRVSVISIDSSDDPDNNALNITINFTIIGQPLNPQSLNILLERSF
jgi:phage baseplate assembly protein W